MAALDAYLNPKCRPSTLDSFVNRRLILAALKNALPSFRGTLVDLGCGEMPYKTLVLSAPSRATQYIGVDLPGSPYDPPDMIWDGRRLDREGDSVDTVLLTEVLEHCPMPQEVLAETYRLLRPGGLVFFTVPFVWPIHCIPYDEYRYTPFALQRILSDCGFKEIQLKATGGRNSVLAVMLGLWIRRKPLTSRVHIVEKWLLSRLMWPVIYGLYASDVPPDDFYESALIVGISGFARKPV